MIFTKVLDIQSFLDNRIDTSSKKDHSGSLGLDRVNQILKVLGNPQKSYPVIHVAGTSGKGSTCNLISQILVSQGLSTGLHTSPYLLDFREGFLVNNLLIAENLVCDYFTEFWEKTKLILENQKPSYHETLVCFEYFVFAKQKVDVAIMEVDVGGRFDCTNADLNSDKICVISDIGYDHTNILGSKINEIAWQKAGIIKKGNSAVFIEQSFATSKKVILKEAKSLAVNNVSEIKNNQSYKIIKEGLDGLVINFQFQNYTLENLKTSLLGSFQGKNLALALASSLLFLEQQKISLNEVALRQNLGLIKLVGRMDLREVKFGGKNWDCILDGAHNEQKMEAFLGSLKYLFANRKLIFVVAFKGSKNYAKMLEKIAKVASWIVATQYLIDQKNISKVLLPAQTFENEKILRKLKIKNYTLESDLSKAIELGASKAKEYQNKGEKSYSKASSNQKPLIVFTGSLYFLGNIYNEIEKLDNC